MSNDDFTPEELAFIDWLLSQGDKPVEPIKASIDLSGPLESPPDPIPQGTVDISWLVYGVEDAAAASYDLGLPYPVDVYWEKDKKESGLAGRLEPEGRGLRYVMPNPAPTAGEHWEDECACFKPHTVVWNGVAAGGIKPATETEPARRIYDGSLMGQWPVNPPRAGRVVNPEKARLAALDKDV